MGKFVTAPLVKFNNLTGKDGDLTLHSQSQYHQNCAATAGDFLQTSSHPDADIANIVDKHRLEDIKANRNFLKPIIDTLKLSAIQNIALRGYRDDGPLDPSGQYPEDNDGNFRHLLRFRIQSGDETLQSHLATHRKQYISKTIQNELLFDMASLLKEDIVKDVCKSPAWVILADETTDLAHQEQMVIVVRYIGKDKGKSVVKEDPICLVNLVQEMREISKNYQAPHYRLIQ